MTDENHEQQQLTVKGWILLALAVFTWLSPLYVWIFGGFKGWPWLPGPPRNKAEAALACVVWSVSSVLATYVALYLRWIYLKLKLAWIKAANRQRDTLYRLDDEAGKS